MKGHSNNQSKINSNLKFPDPGNLGKPGQKLMNFFISNWGRSDKEAYELAEDLLSVDNPREVMLNYFVRTTDNMDNPEGIKYFQELVTEIFESKINLNQGKFPDPDNLGEPGQKLMNFLVLDRQVKLEKAYDACEKILHSNQPKGQLLDLLHSYYIPQDQANELAMDILGDI